jgi:hypothetical protein
LETELAGLAASGASTLVGLMVSDAWAQVRGRLAGFFGRGEEEPAVAEELTLSRAELVAARSAGDEEAAADIEAAWRSRLRRELRVNPAAVPELRLLLAELAPQADDGPAVVVRNSFSGTVEHGSVVQGQNFSGGLTFYGSTPAVPDPEPGPRANPDG